MRRWENVWEVTIKYADTPHGSRGERRVVRVETAAHLRRIVEWARANPGVVGFPYKRVRVRVGEDPTECRAGHGYGGGSATRVKVNWTECACGGHFVYVCQWTRCQDVLVDPPVYNDCDDTEAAIVERSAHLRRPS